MAFASPLGPSISRLGEDGRLRHGQDRIRKLRLGLADSHHSSRVDPAVPLLTADRKEREHLMGMVERREDMVSTRPRLGLQPVQTEVEDARWLDKWHGSTVTQVHTRVETSSQDLAKIRQFLERMSTDPAGRDLARKIQMIYTPHPHQGDIDAIAQWEDDARTEFRNREEIALSDTYSPSPVPDDGDPTRNLRNVGPSVVESTATSKPRDVPWPHQPAIDADGLERLIGALERLQEQKGREEEQSQEQQASQPRQAHDAYHQFDTACHGQTHRSTTPSSWRGSPSPDLELSTGSATSLGRRVGRVAATSVVTTTQRGAQITTKTHPSVTNRQSSDRSAGSSHAKTDKVQEPLDRQQMRTTTPEHLSRPELKNSVLQSAAERLTHIKALLALVDSATAPDHEASTSTIPQKSPAQAIPSRVTHSPEASSAAVPTAAARSSPVLTRPHTARVESSTKSSSTVRSAFRSSLHDYLEKLGLSEAPDSERSVQSRPQPARPKSAGTSEGPNSLRGVHGMEGLVSAGRAWSVTSPTPPPEPTWVSDQSSHVRLENVREAPLLGGSRSRLTTPSKLSGPLEPSLPQSAQKLLAPGTAPVMTSRAHGQQIIEDFGLQKSTEQLVEFARRAREKRRIEEYQRDALTGAILSRGKRRAQRMRSLEDAEHVLDALGAHGLGASDASLRAAAADVHVPKWVIEEAKRRVKARAEKEMREEKLVRARLELEQARARATRARKLERLRAKHQGALASRSLGIGAIPGQGGAACSTAKYLAVERAKSKRLAELRARRAALARWQEMRRSLLLDEQYVGDAAVFARLSTLRECDVIAARERLLAREREKHGTHVMRDLNAKHDEVADLPLFRKLFGQTEEERRRLAPVIEEQKRILEDAVTRAEASEESKAKARDRIRSDEWYKGRPIRLSHSPPRPVSGASLNLSSPKVVSSADQSRWKDSSSIFARDECQCAAPKHG